MRKTIISFLFLIMVISIGFNGYAVADETDISPIWQESFEHFSTNATGWQVSNLVGKTGLKYEASNDIVLIDFSFPIQLNHGRLEFALYQTERQSSNFGIKPYQDGDENYVNFWMSKSGEARLWRGHDPANVNDMYPTGNWYDFAFEWNTTTQTFKIFAFVNGEWEEKWNTTGITRGPNGLYLDGGDNGSGAIGNLRLYDLGE